MMEQNRLEVSAADRAAAEELHKLLAMRYADATGRQIEHRDCDQKIARDAAIIARHMAAERERARRMETTLRIISSSGSKNADEILAEARAALEK